MDVQLFIGVLYVKIGINVRIKRRENIENIKQDKRNG